MRKRVNKKERKPATSDGVLKCYTLTHRRNATVAVYMSKNHWWAAPSKQHQKTNHNVDVAKNRED
jgi:hypothetical protein